MVYKLPTKAAMVDNFAHDTNVTSRLNNSPLPRESLRVDKQISFFSSLSKLHFHAINIQKVRKHTVHIRFFA